MADNSDNNVAIVALIIVAVLVAGAAFLYFTNEPATEPSAIERETVKEPTVIDRDTTIIQEQPAPEELPAPPGEDKDKTSIEHQDSDSETKIEVEE
jgi:hypothetical protein